LFYFFSTLLFVGISKIGTKIQQNLELRKYNIKINVKAPIKKIFLAYIKVFTFNGFFHTKV